MGGEAVQDSTCKVLRFVRFSRPVLSGAQRTLGSLSLSGPFFGVSSESPNEAFRGDQWQTAISNGMPISSCLRLVLQGLLLVGQVLVSVHSFDSPL